MDVTGKCVLCNGRMTSAKLLSLAIGCVLVAAVLSQSVENSTTPAIVTDPTIIVTNSDNVTATTNSTIAPPYREEGGEEGGDAAEEEGGEGGEGSEAPEVEGPEGLEVEEVESPHEQLEDQLEDLVEMYRARGMTASLQALQTMYPGVNLTDIFNEREELEGPEWEGRENEIEGTEGRGLYGVKHHSGIKYLVLKSQGPLDSYGDYELDMGGGGQPRGSYAFIPYKPSRGGIQPTRALAPGVATEGAQARLAAAGPAATPWDPSQVVRHSSGMTASATFGVVVGSILLSWLILGPVVCLAWRWNEKRRDRNKIMLQRPTLHGSVGEGMMDAMVLSELGKASAGSSAASSSRRQAKRDVKASLERNRSELQSFPMSKVIV